MKIAIDSDQSGGGLKRIIVDCLKGNGFAVTDLGGMLNTQYPDIAAQLARRVARGDFDRGILICRTGLGMAMAANKVRGAFAGCCHTEDDAYELAASKHGQILAIGCEKIGTLQAKRIALTFVTTEFAPNKNADRMRELENAK